MILFSESLSFRMDYIETTWLRRHDEPKHAGHVPYMVLYKSDLKLVSKSLSTQESITHYHLLFPHRVAIGTVSKGSPLWNDKGNERLKKPLPILPRRISQPPQNMGSGYSWKQISTGLTSMGGRLETKLSCCWILAAPAPSSTGTSFRGIICPGLKATILL